MTHQAVSKNFMLVVFEIYGGYTETGVFVELL